MVVGLCALVVLEMIFQVQSIIVLMLMLMVMRDSDGTQPGFSLIAKNKFHDCYQKNAQLLHQSIVPLSRLTAAAMISDH